MAKLHLAAPSVALFVPLCGTNALPRGEGWAPKRDSLRTIQPHRRAHSRLSHARRDGAGQTRSGGADRPEHREPRTVSMRFPIPVGRWYSARMGWPISSLSFDHRRFWHRDCRLFLQIYATISDGSSIGWSPFRQITFLPPADFKIS